MKMTRLEVTQTGAVQPSQQHTDTALSVAKALYLTRKPKMTCESLKPWSPVSTAIIALAIISPVTFSATAKAASPADICVADVLKVPSVAGRVVMQSNKGEEPLPRAAVSLKTGSSIDVIAKQPVTSDGTFSFDGLRSGRYVLVVSASGFADFYLALDLKRSKGKADQKEIVVIMDVDFKKLCNGGSAERRVKRPLEAPRQSSCMRYSQRWAGWLVWPLIEHDSVDQIQPEGNQDATQTKQ